MEVIREFCLEENVGIKDVIARWTYNGEKHTSQSITCIRGESFFKIVLNHEDGTFIFDQNTILIDPDFQIKFFFNDKIAPWLTPRN